MSVRERPRSIITIRQESPEEFILIPPPDYTISETSVMILLGKSADISNVKAINKVLQ